MNRIVAHITETSIVIVERNDSNLVCRTVATEARPANLADADTFLAFHSMVRTGSWDLGEAGSVTAPVALADNRFNGTVAARLDQAVGTTHDEWMVLPVREVQDGDLISDMEISAPYVVAGSRFESGTMRVHMVGEGKVWDDRFTTDFPSHRLVQVARKR